MSQEAYDTVLTMFNLLGVACFALCLRKASLVLGTRIIELLKGRRTELRLLLGSLEESASCRISRPVHLHHGLIVLLLSIVHIVSFAVFLAALSVGVRYRYHDRDANAAQFAAEAHLEECRGWLRDFSAQR